MEKLTKNANGQWALEKASMMNDEPKDYDKKTSQGTIACKTDKEPHKDDPKHEEKEQKIASKIKEEAQEVLDMHKERRAEHGEVVEKDAKNPALAPKEVKIKELQGKIDAGKYKPDSKKIADKIVERVKLTKGGQWSLSGNED